MACKSAAHLKRAVNNKNKTDDVMEAGETALFHSTRIDLTPLLIAGGSGFEKIAVFHFHEGKA